MSLQTVNMFIYTTRMIMVCQKRKTMCAANAALLVKYCLNSIRESIYVLLIFFGVPLEVLFGWQLAIHFEWPIG